MAEQYDVTAAERRRLEDQARRRATLRAEFLKQASNPHLHATGEAGAVFDPAIQRFVAMKASNYESFKPTPKTSLMGIAMVGIPIIGFAALLKWYKLREEHKFRTGQVAYKDRSFKFQ